MSTPVFVDPEIFTQADRAQSSRVSVPLPGDPYVAVGQAQLVYTESEPEEAPSEEEETNSSHSLASSDSTALLSPDHLLTYVSPNPTPTRASFHHRTARMTVRAQPVMSPSHSARVTEAMALSDSAFRKRYRSSYKTPSSSLSPAFPVRKRYQSTSELILDTDSEEDEIWEEDTDEDEGHGLDDVDHSLDDKGHGLDDEDYSLDDEGRSLDEEGLGLEESEEEAVLEGQQRAAPVVETVVGEPLGLGYEALRRRELAVEEDQAYTTFEVGQGSGSVPEPERPERVPTLRQPTLTTWIDPEDSIAYIDVPAYLPPAPPAQTPPSPECSFGSLPVSLAPSAVPLPIPSPMISLTVPSPIASPVATPTATISVDEDQFIKVGAQLELHGSILHDHTQRLDVMPPNLFAGIDRDVRELYTRSGVVRDEIFSQRYRIRSLELEQERNGMTFGALWRPVLTLEAWAGHVDTRMTDLSRAGYNDHRLIHDMLVLAGRLAA
ncbi:hypothetical protein Tco_1183159 [Tanacetum coccineum]